MRAIVEYHPEGSKLPPLNVVMCKGREDVTIKVLNACFIGWALAASFVIGWFKWNEFSDWQISDRGGGITRSTLNLLFNYMYSTAPRPPSPDAASMTPLVSCLYRDFWLASEHVTHSFDWSICNSYNLQAGYGYGLPLSRLYAKYLNGDLWLSSMEGYGTDALVYLKVQFSQLNASF